MAIASRRRSAIVASLTRTAMGSRRAALMQHFDLGALDKPEFEQPPLQFRRRQAWAPSPT
jgi:hypothetical protein